MPFIEVNQANLYYETFGTERLGHAPIILIHGATGTGRSNWSLVAPLLARRYRVIVPDCRGHGQSSNPQLSYSFKELADDVAGLVRALGYERAHILGHSNGGNVALVTLVEHPEIIQTAVLQAANAFVSPDLVEKEPPIFDPERVERDAPAWKQEMQDLHGAAHGQDYWRDLLRLTVQAILSEPNYSPADLARVMRPTLVIQGEKDRVNAPARHAQYIAANIPAAELWMPVGIGHTVHDELLFEWIERVSAFLDRRGDPANEALYRLRQNHYPDEREGIFDLRALRPAAPSAGSGGLTLTGKVLTEEQHTAALQALPEPAGEDQVQVQLSESALWGLVNRAVTDLRREPRSLAERISQALLGEAVCVLEERSEWAYVRLETDGYLGWLRKNALVVLPRKEVQSFQHFYNYVVQAEIASYYRSPNPAGTEVEAGKLPFGVCLPVVDKEAGFMKFALPDGRFGWTPESGLLSRSLQPRPDEAGIAFTLGLIRRFVGVPYLWGGRSPFGYDCSGLAQAAWGFLGCHLRRDADQQFMDGASVEGRPRPGDLLYFGEPDEDHRSISHVAISLGGTEMIHANGSAGGISYNSLDPASPLYREWLAKFLQGVRRFA